MYEEARVHTSKLCVYIGSMCELNWTKNVVNNRKDFNVAKRDQWKLSET